MAFSSRLKRQKPPVWAAQTRAMRDPEIEKMLQILQLHNDLDTLSDRLISMSDIEPVSRIEAEAIMAEMREIKALISELRNG